MYRRYVIIHPLLTFPFLPIPPFLPGPVWPLVPARLSADCTPPPGAKAPDSPVSRAVCGIPDAGTWLQELPARLWHLVLTGWPWLLFAALAAALLTFVARQVHRAAWRRAVAGGYWVRLTPPRVVDPGQAGNVWRLLGGLARVASAGWHLAKPPLAFEIHATGGRLTAGLWLPGWVPLAAVTADVARAWPGTSIAVTTPPNLSFGGPAVAGYRLRALRPDTGPLADDTRPPAKAARGAGFTGGAETLRAVYAALGSGDGPGLVQVLIRPAPANRLAALRHAARHPTKPRARPAIRVADALTAVLVGAVRLLADLVTDLISTGPPRSHHHPTGHYRRPVDPLEAKAMREAADKLGDGPHVIAAIRVGAIRPNRRAARAAARTTAQGFVLASRALGPAPLAFAAVALARRRVHRTAWLLFTTAELGALAHLPADPARYGFTTAALHRPHPVGVHRAEPERRTRSSPGWTRTGWTAPPAVANDDPTEFEDDQ